MFVGPFLAFDRKLLYLSFVAALATPLILNGRAPQRAVRAEDAAILFEKTFHDLDGPLVRVTALDTPVPYAPTLEEHFLPNAKKVFAAAKDLARY